MEKEQIIHTMGMGNCGGRCLLHLHVQDGQIRRISTEPADPHAAETPLTACARGIHYHQTFFRDRLTTPMKRVGKRGEGKFVPISWEEAVDTIASEWVRIRDQYGPASRYVHYATGSSAVFRGPGLAKRLLALDGGFLDYYNSYSTACVSYVTPYMYGTNMTGSSYDTLLNAKLIILWGHNPAETVFDGQMFWLKKAKEKGIPIVVIDPRKNDTALKLDAEWIGIRPGTDAALSDGMAWWIYTRGLYDRDFVSRCTFGFDREHMPDGVDPTLCYFDYLMGTRDGVEKTPAWASAITGIPEETIIRLAERYASARPAALIQGYGPQRQENGEQVTRGGIMLAALTGNVGISGGWAGGPGYIQRHEQPHLPRVENPCKYEIPVFSWSRAADCGEKMTGLDGVTFEGKRSPEVHLPGSIKMILNLGGNALINQHGNINETARILQDESKVEFIVVSDLFMTASAKFADILLPGTSLFEGDNLVTPWMAGDFIGFINPVCKPVGESRFEYDWLCEVAKKLGLYEAFSLGRTTDEWLRAIYEELRRQEPELPPYDEAKPNGVYRYKPLPPYVAFAEEAADPVAHPFPTESGRIEIFSRKIYDGTFSEYVSPLPNFIPGREGIADPAIARYPLQLIGWHTKRRCHSVHDKNPALAALDPQCVWMHPEDAKARGLADGMAVRVYNDRGETLLPVKITDRIVRGAAAISQGAWYAPDRKGRDRGGSINVLTSSHPTPLSHGNTQHSILVEIEGTSDAGL